MKQIVPSAEPISADAIAFHSRGVEGFDAKYRTSADFRERYRVWSGLIEKYSSPGFRVLDVGCGTGVFTMVAARHNKEVVGIDGSAEMIAFCRQSRAEPADGHASFVCCTIEQLPRLSLETADLLLCSSVLEYVDDFDLSLQILAGLVKPGGVSIISLPNGSAVYRKLERWAFALIRRPRYLAYVKNMMRFTEFEAAIQRCGGTILEHRYYANINRAFAAVARLPFPCLLNNLFVAVCRKN